MQPNKPVVLVVDDDPVNLDILVQTLEQDYFLIIAKNGKRALDLAFSHHPDLILLDILMPEMDGFEVCQRLKADKETEGIPVIFLSVMESPGQKHRGFEVGGVDYVTKPFHADEVLARVRTHITNKRLREELESHNMLIGMELHEKSRQLETLMNNLPGPRLSGRALAGSEGPLCQPGGHPPYRVYAGAFHGAGRHGAACPRPPGRQGARLGNAGKRAQEERAVRTDLPDHHLME